jgi:hypothetical protein
MGYEGLGAISLNPITLLGGYFAASVNDESDVDATCGGYEGLRV